MFVFLVKMSFCQQLEGQWETYDDKTGENDQSLKYSNKKINILGRLFKKNLVLRMIFVINVKGRRKTKRF